ncbi:hypothetical protein EON77_04170, partial [bacterium]
MGNHAAGHLSAQKIDLFGLRVRWGLLAVLAVVLYGAVSPFVVVGLVAIMIGGGIVVQRMCADAIRY